MRRAVEVLPAADADIDHYFLFIAQDSVDSASRFFDAVRETISYIAEWPESGRLHESSTPRLNGVRSLAIKGFPKHFVYYRVQGNESVLILRILHGSMYVETILDAETD